MASMGQDCRQKEIPSRAVSHLAFLLLSYVPDPHFGSRLLAKVVEDAAWISGCVAMLNLIICNAAIARMRLVDLSDTGLLASFPLSPALQGIITTFLLILFSEVGDKTFFVAFILALQNSKAAVFAGTFGALGFMTLICVGLGQALNQIVYALPESVVDFPLSDVLAIALLTWFGLLGLKSARKAESKIAAEQAEAEEGVKGLTFGSGGLILSTFLLVFFAEWGDKSFLSTTALSAASSPLGVTIGALSGHFVATSLAVFSGSILSNYVSEKSVEYCSAFLFLSFAAVKAYDLVERVVF